MAPPYVVALPPGLDLAGANTISVSAIDPTTGADVTQVNISNIRFQVALLSAPEGELPPVLLLRVR